MSDWSAGYVSDVGYTFGYYTELNPLRVPLAFLSAGLARPEIGTACELGFGQGISTNIHAAGTLIQWDGTDFNPAQAAFARELAGASGACARLYDEAFDEFARRSDLPDFDFIGVHGIWSWISDANRAVIADFVRRKLKVGGVLYISYNTMPGWSAFAPMRHLMTQHADLIGVEGHGIISRVNGALDFTEQLLATSPIYARANPQIAERIKKIKEQNRHYLAHEYFNRDWQPMHVATMGKWLEAAKLTYACSAHYLDNIDTINLTPDQQRFVKEIPDPMFRESVRDFMVNQQFRRDYWVKGARRLSPLEQVEGLRAQELVMVSHRPDVPLKVSGALGEASMSEVVYEPILDLMADHKPRTLGEIEQSVKEKGVTFAHLAQAAMLLAGAGHLAAVQDDAGVTKARRNTDRLNAHLLDKARGSNDVGYLASPVTGGGVPVNRFGQLFLRALGQGVKQPDEWAQAAWQVLSSQGHRLIREGLALESAEQNMTALTGLARTFAEKQVPILKALQVI